MLVAANSVINQFRILYTQTGGFASPFRPDLRKQNFFIRRNTSKKIVIFIVVLAFCLFSVCATEAENLKSLFRPCAMVVPDLTLICEIMLIAEGFQDARILARKFITLYMLCKELLSHQDHYDWGLRAIKSVLVVAGALKVSHSCSPLIRCLAEDGY